MPAWIERRTSELPAGFAGDVRAWPLVLLDGDARTRARSHSSVYVYFRAVRPLLQDWAAGHDHLREITIADVMASLEPCARRATAHPPTAILGPGGATRDALDIGDEVGEPEEFQARRFT